MIGKREYDPSIGRFLTRDSAQGGENWYGYCSNNPQRWVDPSGNGKTVGFWHKILDLLDDARKDLSNVPEPNPADEGMGLASLAIWATLPIMGAIYYLVAKVTKGGGDVPLPLGFKVQVDQDKYDRSHFTGKDDSSPDTEWGLLRQLRNGKGQ